MPANSRWDLIQRLKGKYSLTNVELWSSRVQEVCFSKTRVKMIVCVMQELYFTEVALIKICMCDESHFHLDVTIQRKCTKNTH